MDRQSVQSTNVGSIGYDTATKTLEIGFKGKRETDPETVYSYADVPQDAYDALMAASSKGSHVAKSIRGKYSHTKV